MVREMLRWQVAVGFLLVGIVGVVGLPQIDRWGGLIRVLPEVNLGQVTVGTTVTREYVFTNPHTERATINTVGFLNATNFLQDPPHPARAVFEVVGLVVPATLGPRGQFRFTIRFTPPAAQTYRPGNTLTICVTTETTRQHIHYYIPLVGEGVTGPVTPSTLALHPIQDAKIWEGPLRMRTNFGTGSDLAVGPSHSGFVTTNETRTLIQFDLSRIPAGAGLVSAKLRLCVWEYHGDPLVVTVYRITAPWREGGVTWETHHAHYDYRFEVARTTISGVSMGSWVEWDVTTDVRNALLTGDPHHGWMLIAGAATYARYTSGKFWSREGGVPSPFAAPGTLYATDRRPQLVITTGVPTPVTPPIIDHTMAKDVQKTSPYDPIDRTNTFTTGDQKAVSWLKLGPIDGVCRVDWEWYTPSGDRYHTYTFLIPHPRTGGRTRWDWYVVWSHIDIRGTIVARMPPGEWEVRIYVDRNYVLSQGFTITR